MATASKATASKSTASKSTASKSTAAPSNSKPTVSKPTVSKPTVSKPSVKTSYSPNLPTPSVKTTTPTTVTAGSNGQAQKGLSVGTIVNTNGGQYKITGVNANGSYTSQKIGASSPSTTALTPKAGPISLIPESAPEVTVPAGYVPSWEDPNNVTLDNTDLTGMYNNQQDATLQALREAISASQSKLTSQKANLSTQYDPLKKQAYTASMMQAPVDREMLAQQGLANSGESESARIAREASLGSDITDINMQQAQAAQQIDSDIASLQASGNAQEAQAIADNRAQLTNALIEQNRTNLTLKQQAQQNAMQAQQQNIENQQKAEATKAATAQAQIDAQQTALSNAMKRVDALGYVDATASEVLGLPVGTKSASAQQSAAKIQADLQISKANNDRALQIAKGNNATTLTAASIKKSSSGGGGGGSSAKTYVDKSMTKARATELAISTLRLSGKPSTAAAVTALANQLYNQAHGTTTTKATTPAKTVTKTTTKTTPKNLTDAQIKEALNKKKSK